MNNPKKLATKIIEEIKKEGIINAKDLQCFISLDRQEGKQVIWWLIELIDDVSKKQKLYEIYKTNQFRYDPRLEILMIWISVSGWPVQKYFYSKNII